MTLTNNELKGKLPKVPKVPCWRRNLEITPQSIYEIVHRSVLKIKHKKWNLRYKKKKIKFMETKVLIMVKINI